MKRTILFSLLASIFLSACGIFNGGQNAPQPAQNALHIPELIDSRTTSEIELVMQHGAHEFYAGVQSNTMGFNGDYLGPTIRLHEGEDANITFTNNIG